MSEREYGRVRNISDFVGRVASSSLKVCIFYKIINITKKDTIDSKFQGESEKIAEIKRKCS